MPWVEADFKTNAASDGTISQNKRLSAPLSGLLKKYKVRTTRGCKSRLHPTSLLVKRINDPSDMLKIDLSIVDCTDYEQDITPPYHVQGGQDYEITLTSKGFDSSEQVEGAAGVYYTLWFEL